MTNGYVMRRHRRHPPHHCSSVREGEQWKRRGGGKKEERRRKKEEGRRMEMEVRGGKLETKDRKKEKEKENRKKENKPVCADLAQGAAKRRVRTRGEDRKGGSFWCIIICITCITCISICIIGCWRRYSGGGVSRRRRGVRRGRRGVRRGRRGRSESVVAVDRVDDIRYSTSTHLRAVSFGRGYGFNFFGIRGRERGGRSGRGGRGGSTDTPMGGAKGIGGRRGGRESGWRSGLGRGSVTIRERRRGSNIIIFFMIFSFFINIIKITCKVFGGVCQYDFVQVVFCSRLFCG
jgi:hypothetical protein